MQTTITIAYMRIERDLQRVPVTEIYECRMAAIARIMGMLDAGVTFAVTHGEHDKHDKKPVRHVTLADMAMLA